VIRQILKGISAGWVPPAPHSIFEFWVRALTPLQILHRTIGHVYYNFFLSPGIFQYEILSTDESEKRKDKISVHHERKCSI
jgi:hypothetical protein